MTTSQSKFAQALESDRFVITAECYPPHSGDAGDVKKLASALPALDAVVAADNPDGVYGSSLACAALLAREGRETMVTLSTRDRNRIALESDALGASALGVSAALCLSGNHQSLGAGPQAGSAYDIDSTQLLRLVKDLELPGLLLATIAHPHQRPVELNLIKLKKKIAAGASLVFTQPVFDLEVFQEWMNAAKALKLEQQTPIIASVLPLTSVEQAETLQKRQIYGPIADEVATNLRDAADARQEGLRRAAETASKLKSVAGVRGVNILCGTDAALAGEVVKAAGLA